MDNRVLLVLKVNEMPDANEKSYNMLIFFISRLVMIDNYD